MFKFFTLKKNRFILLTTQRSGSTYLTELLDSHPDIHMAQELFKLPKEGRNAVLDGYTLGDDIGHFLDRFYESRLEKKKAAGFKLMYDQLQSFPQILDYIKKQKVRLIILVRDNLLDVAVSRFFARKSQIYHSETAIEHQPICIDIPLLHQELQKIAAANTHNARLTAQLPHCLTVSYEALVKHQEETLRTIQEFLQVRKEPKLSCSLIKIINKDLQQSISNYPVVYKSLKFTPFEKFAMPLNWRQEDLLFIHIPKVAGSSIEKMLYKSKGKVGHIKAKKLLGEDPERFATSLSFAFVRNPYDRLVSAYFYLTAGGRNSFDSAWATTHLSQYSSFEEFVLALETPDFCKQIFAWQHFTPQYEFICDDKLNILVDYLGRFEQINVDILPLQNYFNLPDLPWENRSKHQNYRSYFTPKMQAIAFNIYRQDFEVLGYAYAL